ncbi:MAG: hypothetical protein N4A57_01800 [Anaeromicrobium sp.]|jgi:hypothetical protein|uniref:hypothetical protein n=1 Tax=Anaeromicrobium sp. TaxID=1929132 RepID=UPI0025EF9081|nr:hypothetical protein [Anaeromicrobium sp.]MCT4593000.1 hypothetical protein [Anaeromicrobium sp.]
MDLSDNRIIMERLIERYDYGGAIEMMEIEGILNHKALNILYSCKHRLNFDFKSAMEEIEKIKPNSRDKTIKTLEAYIKLLEYGSAEEIFSELIENTKIQLLSSRYIDFLSRVYRLKEAILKYIFIVNHTGKDKFSFMDEGVQKKAILKILKKRYKIYNPNLSLGVTQYINKHLYSDKRYVKVLSILNSTKMNNIIELRHNSISGHGFFGVSRHLLNDIYGDPFEVIDDFIYILDLLNVRIYKNQFHRVNRYLINEIEIDMYYNCLRAK